MNTTQKGDIAHAAVLAALVKAGHNVLLPFSDGLRYDIAVEVEGQLIKIQIKSGLLKNGAVQFRDVSTRVSGDKIIVKSYKGDVDFFGVYCQELDTVYLVPINECQNSVTSLRVEPTKNGQRTNIRYADSYLADVVQFGRTHACHA